MEVCCHGDQEANGTFKKLFNFLELISTATNCCPLKELVMSNFDGDFNIVSASLIGFG